jgi:hypothetical protein
MFGVEAVVDIFSLPWKVSAIMSMDETIPTILTIQITKDRHEKNCQSVV